MSETADAFEDIVRCSEFFELIADGVPPNLAGYQVGWSPRDVKRKLADPDFAELVMAARERAIDWCEKALFDLAKSRNLGAIQMVLYNLRQGDWKDVKRIEVKTEHTVNIGEIGAAKEIIAALLRENGTKALQPGGGLDVIEDAEVISDDYNTNA